MASLSTFDAQSRAFFNKAENFHPDFHTTTPLSEFERLGRARNWAEASKTYRQNWNKCFGIPFNRALLQQHRGTLIGTSAPAPADLATSDALDSEYTTEEEEEDLVPGFESLNLGPEHEELPDTDKARGNGFNEFFENHRQFGFVPDYTRPFHDEFGRLTDRMKWTRKSNEWWWNRTEALKAEVKAQFNDRASNLLSWQLLCEKVRIAPIPRSITKCKEELSKRKVNMWDFIESLRTNKLVRIFPNKHALAEYTTGNKVMPLHAAKDSGIIRIFLEDFGRP